MLAPSSVPMVRAPFMQNFMLPVPDASLPAVDICSDKSAAGYTRWPLVTLKFGRNTTFRRPRTSGSRLTTSPTAVISLIMSLARW